MEAKGEGTPPRFRLPRSTFLLPATVVTLQHPCGHTVRRYSATNGKEPSKDGQRLLCRPAGIFCQPILRHQNCAPPLLTSSQCLGPLSLLSSGARAGGSLKILRGHRRGFNLSYPRKAPLRRTAFPLLGWEAPICWVQLTHSCSSKLSGNWEHLLAVPLSFSGGACRAKDHRPVCWEMALSRTTSGIPPLVQSPGISWPTMPTPSSATLL